MFTEKSEEILNRFLAKKAKLLCDENSASSLPESSLEETLNVSQSRSTFSGHRNLATSFAEANDDNPNDDVAPRHLLRLQVRSASPCQAAGTGAEKEVRTPAVHRVHYPKHADRFGGIRIIESNDIGRIADVQLLLIVDVDVVIVDVVVNLVAVFNLIFIGSAMLCWSRRAAAPPRKPQAQL